MAEQAAVICNEAVTGEPAYIRNSGPLICGFGSSGKPTYYLISERCTLEPVAEEALPLTLKFRPFSDISSIGNDTQMIYYSPLIYSAGVRQLTNVNIDYLEKDREYLVRVTTHQTSNEYKYYVDSFNVNSSYYDNQFTYFTGMGAKTDRECIIMPCGETVICYNYPSDTIMFAGHIVEKFAVGELVDSLSASVQGKGMQVVPVMITTNANNCYIVCRDAEGQTLYVLRLVITTAGIEKEVIANIPIECMQMIGTCAVSDGIIFIRTESQMIGVQLD